MNSCPHDAQLTPYLLGDLPSAEAEAVRLHLETCAACRAEAAALAPLLATLREALVADAETPATLTPDRLERVLATPPATEPRSRTGHRPRHALRWYWFSSLVGLAATLFLVFSFVPGAWDAVRPGSERAFLCPTAPRDVSYEFAERLERPSTEGYAAVETTAQSLTERSTGVPPLSDGRDAHAMPDSAGAATTYYADAEPATAALPSLPAATPTPPPPRPTTAPTMPAKPAWPAAAQERQRRSGVAAEPSQSARAKGAELRWEEKAEAKALEVAGSRPVGGKDEGRTRRGGRSLEESAPDLTLGVAVDPPTTADKLDLYSERTASPVAPPAPSAPELPASPRPAEFNSVAAVRSPLLTRGVGGSRSAAPQAAVGQVTVDADGDGLTAAAAPVDPFAPVGSSGVAEGREVFYRRLPGRAVANGSGVANAPAAPAGAPAAVSGPMPAQDGDVTVVINRLDDQSEVGADVSGKQKLAAGESQRAETTADEIAKPEAEAEPAKEALDTKKDAVPKTALQRKLASIVVPEVSLRDANLEDVVAFLEASAREFGAEPADGRKAPTLAFSKEPGDRETPEHRIPDVMVSFSARNIPLSDLVEVIAERAQVVVAEEDGRIVFKPQRAADGETIAVPSDRSDLPDRSDSPPPPPPTFNPVVETAEQPLSTFAIDVDTAAYALVRQSLLDGRLPDPGLVRTEEIVNAFDYGDHAPEHATFRIFAEGAPAPFAPGRHLVRLGIKGRRLGREEQRPAMLTFLVDASGSMAQPDRIGFVRQALAELTAQLGPADRVQLVSFNETARVVLDATEAARRDEILAAFDRIQPTGPTNLERGMNLAYHQAIGTFQPGAENRVVLVSDGVANLGTGDASDILGQIDAARRQGITLSVFGVGRGTYNDRMLEQLANRGDGTYRFLDSPHEIRRAFVDDLAATLYTIASDVKIQVEWNPATVVRYRQLGYENRALTAQQFRDDSVDAGEVGSGQAVTALYEVELGAVQAGQARAALSDAALGTVRVRYRPVGGGPVEEIAQAILPTDLAASVHDTRPAFRVAVAAAAFAERLRQSPHAAQVRFDAVADLLRPAALELSLDTRIAELVRLVEAAAALTR